MYLITPEIKQIVRQCFPEYTGRKYRVSPFTGPMNISSYWDGGSRDYWACIDLSTNKTAVLPENGTPFTPNIGELKELPFNWVLVRHSIFCGIDSGITLFVHPDNLNRLLLAESPEISEEEKIVLKYTATLKSSYGGVSNYRYVEAARETGITEHQWNVAKASCQQKKLLNKAGAITNEGRNCLGKYYE